MGNWGTGFLQSDTYCETYEKFIEEYDKGKPISQITQDILEEWFEEFEEDDDDDGVDVFVVVVSLAALVIFCVRKRVRFPNQLLKTGFSFASFRDNNPLWL